MLLPSNLTPLISVGLLVHFKFFQYFVLSVLCQNVSSPHPLIPCWNFITALLNSSYLNLKSIWFSCFNGFSDRHYTTHLFKYCVLPPTFQAWWFFWVFWWVFLYLFLDFFGNKNLFHDGPNYNGQCTLVMLLLYLHYVLQ